MNVHDMTHTYSTIRTWGTKFLYNIIQWSTLDHYCTVAHNRSPNCTIGRDFYDFIPRNAIPRTYNPTLVFFSPSLAGETHFNSRRRRGFHGAPIPASTLRCRTLVWSLMVVVPRPSSRNNHNFIQRQYLGYGNVAKGWDGFQLGKGAGGNLRSWEGEERGPAWTRC
jgi:hypothetical protein